MKTRFLSSVTNVITTSTTSTTTTTSSLPRWPTRRSGLANPLDLRSDTLTRPTAKMRSKMVTSLVGDDVFGDDPTILELESFAAKLTGKQSAAFVASGTMGNLTSIIAHTERRGSEIICGDRCHIFLHEQGGSATLAGVHTRTIATQPDGTLPIKDILRAIRPGNGTDRDDGHYPRTALVCIENTHNDCGGVVLPLEYQSNLALVLHELSSSSGKSVKLHLDGARAGNAAVFLNKTLLDVCTSVDSASICLSKGLGAPVGSVVVGEENFIWRVKRARKALGGGWRQAGVLAAAGIIALEEMEITLRHDHQLAQKFAHEIGQIPGVSLAVKESEITNMVFFRITPPTPSITGAELVQLLANQEGMLMGYGYGPQGDLIRAAIHRDVNEDELLTRGVKAIHNLMTTKTVV
jgi:threonine aldolase